MAARQSARPSARLSEASQLLGSTDVKDASTQVRIAFVRKVYGILTFQLILTVCIAAPLSQAQVFVMKNAWLLYVAAAVTLCSVCVMACCRDVCRKFPQNYAFLLVFTVFEGVIVGFVSAAYTWQSVLLAAGLTVAVFAGMTVFAWSTSTDFTGMGPYLFGALLAMSVFGMALSIMMWCGVVINWMLMLYDLLGVLLCTLYIVFDTQLILGEWGGHSNQYAIDDYIFAALSLYMDIVRLFMHLLRLFGQRR